MPGVYGAAAALPSTLATDVRGLEALRSRAAADPKAAVRQAAKQFEALFMNELMKSMRATTMASPESLGGAGASGGMGTEMLDQQYAQQLAGLPGGLHEAITRHLERQMGLTPGPIPATGSANNSVAPIDGRATRVPQKGAAGFVDQHQDAARAAEAKTGIPAAFMISQAALETGWGRKEIRHADGSPSYNLFGVKAGAGWTGPVAEITTTEYVNGKAQKVVARFRAYSSYAESFADYGRLMQDSPRYAGIASRAAKGTLQGQGGAVAFAQGLQRAGYATDPAYADKLTRVINTTLRLQRGLSA
ncbi:MAG: flagellar assembly peptidoglycan hydrolase FlgJ [Burkholderiales bacterium]|nr:flagellar assembly peptidoglycan hydrolase FlgJ [Burkholderiales bacterium]